MKEIFPLKFVFVLILSLNIFVDRCQSTKNVCPFPPKFKNSFDFNWKSKDNEWQNNRNIVDSFILELSWVPTYCRSIPQWLSETKFECSRAEIFGLVVHGLWPQSSTSKSIRDQPRNCFNDEQLSLNLIRRYYCLMPDEYLMQAEWEKHGSCYFSTPSEYFDQIELLFNRLNLPNLHSIKSSGRTTIRNEFLRLNSQLKSSSIQIFVDDQNQLENIRLCYDLQFRYRSC